MARRSLVGVRVRIFVAALAVSLASPALAIDVSPLATATGNAGPDGDPYAFFLAVDTAARIPGRAQRMDLREVLADWQAAHPGAQEEASVVDLRRALAWGRDHRVEQLTDDLVEAATVAEVARRAALAAATLDELEALAVARDRAFWSLAELARARVAELTFTPDEAAAFEVAWRQRCERAVEMTLVGALPDDLDGLEEDLRRVRPAGYADTLARIAAAREAAEAALEAARYRAYLEQLPSQITAWVAALRWLDATVALAELDAADLPLPFALVEARDRCAAPHEALIAARSSTPAAQWLEAAIAARCRGTARPKRADAHVRLHYRLDVVESPDCAFLTDAIQAGLDRGDPDGQRLWIRFEGQCRRNNAYWTTTEVALVRRGYVDLYGGYLPPIYEEYVVEHRELGLAIEGRVAVRHGARNVDTVPVTFERALNERQNIAIGDVPARRFSADTMTSLQSAAAHPASEAVRSAVEGWLERESTAMRDSVVAAALGRHDEAGQLEAWIVEAWAQGHPSGAFRDWLDANYRLAWWQI